MSTYKKVAKWNEKCGNVPLTAGTEAYYNNVLNQLKRIAEELNETIEAANSKNLLELVDGGLDLDVVVAGLNYIIGADYDSGISRVLTNNDLKHTKSIKIARNWLTFHADNGVDATIHSSQVGSSTYHCVRRNEDGKILKYGNFPKVDLTDTLPQIALEVYILVTNEESLSNEAREYAEKYGVAVILADNLEKDSPQVKIMEGILNDAESGEAFVYIANGQLHSAENFTVEGPVINNKPEEE